MGVGQTAAAYQGQEIKTIVELLAYIEASTSKYGLEIKQKPWDDITTFLGLLSRVLQTLRDHLQF